MTDAHGEHVDMCVYLTGANWLVHSRPDECTTGRDGEKNGQKTEVMHGGQDMCGEHDRVEETWHTLGSAGCTKHEKQQQHKKDPSKSC